MALHACLQNRKVVKIVSIDSDEDYFKLIKEFTAIIRIEEEIIRPNVGWALEGVSWVQGDAPSHSIINITPRQFRQAWVLSGKTLSSIDEFIQTLPEPQKSLAFIEWEYSITFQRNNPMLNQLAPLFGVTSSQLDDLFILGATL